ncbi:MAG: serine hydrolase [Bacteroidota bacterium]
MPKGSKVHELSQGLPIAAFSEGGEKERALEDFLTEQKVAGLLILQDGKIRLERYARGHSESGLWSSLSVAKSVTSTLAGVAIKDGYIKSVDDCVTDYIPGLEGSAYEKVTIRHLLTMTTGVRWNENYTDPNADIARFSTDSIEPGMNATVSYMRRLPAEAEPGKKWVYSTGETHLLGVLVSSATHQTLSHYLSSKIWIPYGMEQKATWTLDRTGHEMAGCCLQMTLRDFARFGQFVLEDGRINGESIVPGDWFETATHAQVPLWPGGGYGFGWWIFNGNTFQALGIHGQMIHIDPARQLVIAVNSAWPEADSNERHLAVAGFVKTLTDEIDKEK